MFTSDFDFSPVDVQFPFEVVRVSYIHMRSNFVIVDNRKTVLEFHCNLKSLKYYPVLRSSRSILLTSKFLNSFQLSS